MKIDLSKVDKVTIKDENGKVIANIKPGQITLSIGKLTGTILEIKEEPKKHQKVTW